NRPRPKVPSMPASRAVPFRTTPLYPRALARNRLCRIYCDDAVLSITENGALRIGFRLRTTSLNRWQFPQERRPWLYVVLLDKNGSFIYRPHRIDYLNMWRTDYNTHRTYHGRLATNDDVVAFLFNETAFIDLNWQRGIAEYLETWVGYFGEIDTL